MAQTLDWDQLDPVKFALFGSTAFLGVRVLLYPSATVKTRLQVQHKKAVYRGTIHAFRSIIKQSGVRGLYPGFMISNVNLVSRQIYFTLFEKMRAGIKHLNQGRLSEKQLEVVRNLVAGGTASSVYQVFTNPIDLVAQRMMVQNLHSDLSGERGGGGGGGRGASASPSIAGGASARTAATGATAAAAQGLGAAGTSSDPSGNSKKGLTRPQALPIIRDIWQREGFKGFYKGFGVSVIQFAPSSAIMWGSYGLYSRLFDERLEQWGVSPNRRHWAVSVLGGAAAGSTTVLITNPLDVIRTRLMVRGGDSTVRSTAKHLFAEEGVRGFYKGASARVTSFAPAAVLIMTAYETVKTLARKTPDPLYEEVGTD